MVRVFRGSKFLNSKFKIQNSKLEKLVPLLLNWFAQNARDLPWRRTRDPYAIWVSEIMLQQTQVKTVIPFWERWMRELPTIQSLADAPSEQIHKLWEGLGYYTRVRNMQKAAQQIVAADMRRRNDARTPSSPPRYLGGYVRRARFPDRFENVLALPGIGRYTAGAICSIAFNQPTPILDGNVIRVLTRVFGIAENPREKETNARLWRIAEELVCHARDAKVRNKGRDSALRPYRNACSHLNQSLMELGALICTPRQPKCSACPAKELCVAYRESKVEELPNLGKRVVATERRFKAFIVSRRRKYLVRQRPAGVVNAHLWEFPNAELNGETDLRAIARSALGFQPNELQPLCTIKHSITRYRISLEAFMATTSRKPNCTNTLSHRWLNLSALDKLSFPSAHRKLLTRIAALSN